jgi:hypothetical protein
MENDKPIDDKTVDPVKAWCAARNAALRTLDLAWARANAPRVASDAALLVSMHKTRYNVTEIEDALRLESGEWLRERGMRSLHGLPLLPPGQLPKGV